MIEMVKQDCVVGHRGRFQIYDIVFGPKAEDFQYGNRRMPGQEGNNRGEK